VEPTPSQRFTGHGSRFTTDSVCVCVCAQRGEIRGCFLTATGVGEPVEEDRNG
jgi:hypothetical protein